MKIRNSGLFVIAMFAVAACGSTPSTNAKSSEAAAPAAVPVADADSSGLGRITYAEGLDRAECRRLRRTGSRIPRDVCKPNTFNGLYPGGLNMGTAGESQPGYGASSKQR